MFSTAGIAIAHNLPGGCGLSAVIASSSARFPSVNQHVPNLLVVTLYNDFERASDIKHTEPCLGLHGTAAHSSKEPVNRGRIEGDEQLFSGQYVEFTATRQYELNIRQLLSDQYGERSLLLSYFQVPFPFKFSLLPPLADQGNDSQIEIYLVCFMNPDTLCVTST